MNPTSQTVETIIKIKKLPALNAAERPSIQRRYYKLQTELKGLFGNEGLKIEDLIPYKDKIFSPTANRAIELLKGLMSHSYALDRGKRVLTGEQRYKLEIAKASGVLGYKNVAALKQLPEETLEEQSEDQTEQESNNE